MSEGGLQEVRRLALKIYLRYSERTASSLIQHTRGDIAGLGTVGELKGSKLLALTRKGSAEECRLELVPNDRGCFMSQEKDMEQALRPSMVEERTSNFRGGMVIMTMTPFIIGWTMMKHLRAGL